MQKPLVVIDALHRFLDARLQKHPTYVDALNVRALSAAVQGDLDAARDDLAEALRLRPGYTDAFLNLIWLHTVRDEPGAYKALLHSRRAEDLSPVQRTHLELLRLQRWEGRQVALRRWISLEAATQRHPWIALDGLWLAVRARDPQMLPQVVKLLHEHHCEWSWHLQSVSDSTQTQHAKQAFEAWSTFYAGNPLMDRLLIAQLPLLQPEQGAEAEGLLHWATLVSADLCAYWTQLGCYHDRFLRNEQAEDAFHKAIAIDAERPQAHLQLGHLYAALGRAEAAAAVLEVVCRLRPLWADAHYLLGLVCEDLGLSDRAENEYRVSLQCNPGFLLPNIARGKLLATLGRKAEAVQLLESVRKQGVESLDLHEELVALHTALGNEPAAHAARRRIKVLVAEQD
jgi:tetratricopeptide (TPR) repeat protein